MNGVTIDRLLKLAKEQGSEVYEMSFQACQIAILYGLVRLLAQYDPDELPSEAKDFFTQASWWCEQKFRLWGLTPEEIECFKHAADNGDGFCPEPE